MELATIFADGMVIQRNQPITVFGMGTGTFSAEFLGECRTTEANGLFSVTFPPHEAGGPYTMKLIMNGREHTISNIMVGEVIFLSGQSNAELPIAQTDSKTISFEDNDMLRCFFVSKPKKDENGGMLPPADEEDIWKPLRAEEAQTWSAIAYHTGLYYAQKLGVTVGMIDCSMGASVIQSFLSPDEMRAFANMDLEYNIDRDVHGWNKDCYLYDTMVKKLFPFGVGKAIWYQGESNRTLTEAAYYDQMLVALVSVFRAGFANPTLPIAVVQINDYPAQCEPGVTAIQQAQERAVQQIAHCALVKIRDMGQAENIHPTNKAQVSSRICLALDALES